MVDFFADGCFLALHIFEDPAIEFFSTAPQMINGQPPSMQAC